MISILLFRKAHYSLVYLHSILLINVHERYCTFFKKIICYLLVKGKGFDV
jgi:hypothetical protein